MKKILSSLAIIAAILLLRTTTVSAAGKITLSPNSSSINEGQSQAISVQLDMPITPGNQVSLSIISSNPETATISPSSLMFNSSDWWQTKSFNVVVPANGTYGDTRNILVLATASSGMAYYSGYGSTATVHVTDMTAEPGTSDPQDPPDEQPPDEEDSVEETPNETPEQTGNTGIPYGEDALVADDSHMYDAVDSASKLTSKELRAKRANAPTMTRLADAFTPGQVSAKQLFINYLVLLSIAAGLAGAWLYIRRSIWWRRQEGRDVRWFYRNIFGKQKPPAKKSKKKAKTKGGQRRAGRASTRRRRRP